ncbi:MAG: BrnA antitoxin family protein [Albidovulum sp.]|nr:BrnA antitoxin family protein [Albidovulum sp.]
MNKKVITRITLEDAARRKSEGKTDWERLRREEAAGIEPEKDADEGEFDWSRAQVTMPRPKQAISVRLDTDVLDFFRAQGRGYQTRINAVLRSYMKAHEPQ